MIQFTINFSRQRKLADHTILLCKVHGKIYRGRLSTKIRPCDLDAVGCSVLLGVLAISIYGITNRGGGNHTLS